MPEITINIPANTPPDQIAQAVAQQTEAFVAQVKQSAEREQRIANLHDEVSKLVGEKFGSTDALIHRLLPFASAKLRKTVGAAPAAKATRRKRAKIDDAFIAQVKGMMAAGKSKLAISRDLGCSYPLVLKAAKS